VNNRVQEFREKSGIIEWESKFGAWGTGNGQFKITSDVAVDSRGNLWVADEQNNRVQEITPTGGYVTQFGAEGAGNGQFKAPKSIAIDAKGNLWIADANNNRIQRWVTNGGTSQIVYYTAEANSKIPACGGHAEWANLPCQIQPAKQPETGGLPNLPVTTYTYNMWDEPEVTKSTSGEATRTETTGYDAAGRVASKETTSTTGHSLPKVSYEYSPSTGLLVKQSTGTGTEEQKIASGYNTLGQMTSYTDADGKTATYEYENGKDARLKIVNDGKGTQTYTYDETQTGELTELSDSAAGTFGATYDVEGRLLSEKLPDGLTGTLTYNAAGEATGLEYHKANNCGTSCTWFTDTVVPSIHGQWVNQTTTLASQTIQNYAYDAAGRLTQVQRLPGGKECTTRIYAYDQDSNRISLTTRPPGVEGKCATEGGTTETHSYDTADRLIDPEVKYNPFGDIEALTAADAGGSILTSKYYADGQIESQEQANQTIGYGLDPGRRVRETLSTGKVTATEIENYAGPGSTPSWSSETSGNWTRSIPGIASSLDAIQHNGETPILQLSNLHGDIIATAYKSETATALASTIAEANEYGLPATEAPPKYSWLGAHEIPTELSSGVTMMGARSYIPQLGRFLQPDPSPGGSANAYAYTHGNPVNETDLSGAWSLNQTSGGLGSVETGPGVQIAEGTGVAAGAIMPAPVNAQIEAAFQANPPWDQITAGTEEYEEFEEEGEGEEYAAWHHPAAGEHGTGGTEEGILFQLLGPEASQDMRTSLMAMCSMELHEYARALPRGACMEYVDLIGEIVGGIEKAAKGGWKVMKHAASNVWHWVRTHASLVKQISCGISGGGAGVLAGVGAGVFTQNLYIGGSIGAAVASGVTYACEHQRHF
jgi:RHS repeat-associated protein